MNIFAVYCHPSRDSFTYKVKESFVNALEAGGHSVTVSDLYAMGFDPVMKEPEYKREAYYREDLPIPDDVSAEQKKLDNADIAVFIYPDFWTASPAMLEGWFQRVLTYGYAYGPNPSMKKLKKAVFLMKMGGSLKDDIRKDR